MARGERDFHQTLIGQLESANLPLSGACVIGLHPAAGHLFAGNLRILDEKGGWLSKLFFAKFLSEDCIVVRGRRGLQ
jgi:hypothetical protein